MRRFAILALLVSALATGCARAAAGPAVPTDGSAPTDANGVTTSVIEARNLAREAAVWGAALVIGSRTWSGLGQLTAGTNRFAASGSLITPRDRLVPAPNVDTLYGAIVADVTDGPLTITVPPTDPARFQSLQVIDQWTDVPLYAGTRVPGNAGGTYVLKADREGSSGIAADGPRTVVTVGTKKSVVLFRVAVSGPEDVPNARAALAGLRVTPTPGPATTTSVPRAPGRPIEALNQDATFFDELGADLVGNPPAPDEVPVMERFRRIGVGPGVVTTTVVTDPRIRAALTEGVLEARVAVAQSSLPTVNGWQIAREGIGTYDGATPEGRLFRTTVATCCWGAPPPAEAVYPLATVDADGAELDSTRRYTLTFPSGALPPVIAPGFWSVTMYDRDFFLSVNPIDRYALGDRSGLRPGPDGSVTLYLQREDPGGEKSANWLPTPAAGPFRVMLRAYIPGDPLVKGDWNPPPIVRLA